jgi:hypothetical protein
MAAPHELASRLRNRYPMLQYFTDRTFGVEIEICGLDYLVTPLDGGIIKPYNIRSMAKDGRVFDQLLLDHKIPLEAGKDSWHFEEDSSIIGRGGAELVSPILSGMEGLIQAYRALQFLGDLQNVRINESCGFHVHHGVDRQVYSCEQLRTLVRMIHPLEKHLYLTISGDRQNAKTCRPLELDVEAFLKPCDAACENGGCRIKQLWYSASNSYDPDAAARYDKTRYHGLNLHSYWYRSTIEFRYHSAVLSDIDEAMQWIIFTQFLIELSQGPAPVVSFQSEANKWLKTIFTIYLTCGYSDRIRYGIS